MSLYAHLNYKFLVLNLKIAFVEKIGEIMYAILFEGFARNSVMSVGAGL